MLLMGLASFGGCHVPAYLERAPKPHQYSRDPATGRGFYYYVPSTYRHDKPAPLIISCHGTPPYDVAQHHVREWKALAERNGCIVVCPELIGTDGILGDGPLAGMFADERYILSLISLMGYRYNVDRANVMITGFSGGGFPTYWVGLRHPDVFSVIAARNCNFSEVNTDGWFPDEARRIAILVYYGSNDPGAIQAQSRNAIRYLRGQGFSVRKKVLQGFGHQRKPEVAMDFFLAHMHEPVPSLPIQ